MTLQWSDYAIESLKNASDYIAEHFYPQYADAFEADVFETAESLLGFPNSSCEAYPEAKRPDLRKVLCKNKNWWIFYRVYPDVIEISEVSYFRQREHNPFKLGLT